MEKVKYLILGAGVSGLTFANHIGVQDYLIIEKESEAGGYCRTKRSGEYIWDFAGHFFHFSHPELKEKFEAITTPENSVYKLKNTKIYYKGYYVDYPFQKNIHQLSKEEMIDCLYDLFEKVEKEKYDNFLDMLYGKFGKGITERFLKPYNEKLYACDLNFLDVEAMGRFFPYADLKDIIKNMKVTNNASYNQSFLYPKQGASVLIEKLLEGIKENGIRYGENVISINTKKKMVTTDCGEYGYDYLISSIPMNEFAVIIDIDVDQSVFSYNQVLVFNLGFDHPSVDSSIHWIYVPSKEVNFYRAGYYNNIIGSDNLSMYIEIGYPKDCVISQTEIESQLKVTLLNLQKMGIITTHKLVDYQAIVMNPAYVHITKSGMEAVADFKKHLEKQNIYTIGRYGDWKYCSIEDCMIDALKMIEHITNCIKG
ncbi:LPS biosynthesis protein [Clostridiaceae bacterium]|nr:LPS biosynthesis protein [Clostridiaceae bacterium]RKI17428.1 LPS biosynthesis protein [bacterium 1XD21-70]